MRKFRLIKEYPGSPKLGTVVQKEFNISFLYLILESESEFRLGVTKEHVEDNPEYWEEIIENMFMVSTRNAAFYNSYEIVTVSHDFKPKEYQYLFFTKEDAEEFIFNRKPCLSYFDLILNFSENTKKNRLEVDIDELRKLVIEKQNGK